MPLDDDIEQELRAQGLIGHVDEWRQLHKGTINDNLYVRSGEHEWFIKHFSAATPITIDRQAQFHLQQQLAEQGFAPEPVYLSQRKDFAVEPWLDLTTVAQLDSPRQLKIAFLAERLAAIHAMKMDVPALDLVSDWQHYLSKGATLTEQQQTRFSDYQALWQETETTTFCHHDLCFDHICMSPRHMTLDWEYAGLSAPVFDLACCCWINQMDREEQKTLIKVYAAEVDASWLSLNDAVQQYVPLAEMTSQLWLQVAGVDEQSLF